MIAKAEENYLKNDVDITAILDTEDFNDIKTKSFNRVATVVSVLTHSTNVKAYLMRKMQEFINTFKTEDEIE